MLNLTNSLFSMSDLSPLLPLRSMAGATVKKLPNQSKLKAFVPFLVSLLVLLPLWIVVMLPLALVYNVLAYPFKLCSKKSKRKYKQEVFDISALSRPSKGEVTGRNDRDYDVILFGATGFTGGMPCLWMYACF